jgi:predicted nucleic acid-binding protein
MARVYIDTELWSFAIKKPKENYSADAKDKHNLASSFLKQKFQKDRIFISFHQLAELFHALSFRGSKLPVEKSRDYLEKLVRMENVTIIANDLIHFRNAMQMSQDSNIHIWDFLCILPIIDHIEIIYTCDSHFKNDIFKTFNKPIENPLGKWLPI